MEHDNREPSAKKSHPHLFCCRNFDLERSPVGLGATVWILGAISFFAGHPHFMGVLLDSTQHRKFYALAARRHADALKG